MTLLTELESRLYQDKSGCQRDDMLVQLDVAEQRLTQTLSRTWAARQRHECYQLIEACQQARQTIIILWQRYHFPLCN